MIEPTPLLDIRQLDSGYGRKQVLFGVSMSLSPGAIASVIGPNGAGKSTVLKVVHGLLPAWSGDILYQGVLLDGVKSSKRVAIGIAFVPQGRRVFPDLSVHENLEMGGIHLRATDVHGRIDDTLEFFPALRARYREKAGRLSGGEQQMVALGRALISKPKLLMLDEPSLGLAPNIVSQVFEKIREINEATGTTMLVVEQKVREVLKISHKVYSLKLGRVVFEGEPGALIGNREKMRELFL